MESFRKELLFNLDWTDVSQLVRSNRDLARGPVTSDGQFLLHYACYRSAPFDCIQDIITSYPFAVEIKTNDGDYPLHLACKGGHSISVIQLLISKYPKAIKEGNSSGWYPLHYACYGDQLETVVQLLIDKYPKALEESSNEGWYPLHVACQYVASKSVIQLLIDKHPNAIKAQVTSGSKSGWYPLHIALANYKSDDITRTLITKYPNAIKQRSDDGYYPIHLACYYNQPLPIVELLVEYWPQSLYQTDNSNKSPLDLAKNPHKTLFGWVTSFFQKVNYNERLVQWIENYLSRMEKGHVYDLGMCNEIVRTGSQYDQNWRTGKHYVTGNICPNLVAASSTNGEENTPTNAEKSLLLQFLFKHEDCFKCSVDKFYVWLQSEDVHSISDFATAIQDNNFALEMKKRGLKGFKTSFIQQACSEDLAREK